MAYKVTISDGTILEKSIVSITFKTYTPPDDSYCMRTYTINSMQITGRIGAGEKTVSLYEWSLLPTNNSGCYKEIVVEQTHASQTVRIVKFSKAFVVDYSESYAKGEGFGHFSILIRQLAGVDIELTNEITPQPAMIEPSNKVEELIPPLVQSTGIVAASPIVKKDRPNFTDILAKKKMMQDDGNVGVGIVDVPSKADLDAYRAELGVPQTHTIAVGKTDIEGLGDFTFKGASPNVRKEAGLPKLDETAPNREIRAPTIVGLNRNHAEEELFYRFEEAVKGKGLNPAKLKGELNIHISKPEGVCPTCLQGLSNPDKAPGIFKQFSDKYPGVKINVTSEGSEGAKAFGRQNFIVKNGKYVE